MIPLRGSTGLEGQNHILASWTASFNSTKMICHVWMDPNMTSYLNTIIFPICSIWYLVSPHLISTISKTDGLFPRLLWTLERPSLRDSKAYRVLQMHTGPFFDKRNILFSMVPSIRDLWNCTFEITTCDTRGPTDRNIAFIEKRPRVHLDNSIRFPTPQSRPLYLF